MKTYNDEIATIYPNFSEEINSAKKFKQVCNKYILNSINLGGIPTWCKIIGYNNHMFENAISDSYEWFYELNTVISSDIDMLKTIIDFGYNEQFHETNLIVQMTLNYNFESLNDKQYHPIQELIYKNVDVEFDTKITVDTINAIHPPLVANTIKNRRVFGNKNTRFEEFLYRNRKKLSCDLITVLSNKLHTTSSVTTKVFLELLLGSDENTKEQTIHSYEDSHVYIKGTFVKLKEILEHHNLKTYYSGLYDMTKIESVEHLEYLSKNETTNFGKKMVEFFRGNLNASNEILNLLFVDENVTIAVFESMDDHNDIYDLILDKRPSWINFKVRFHPEQTNII